LKAAEHCRIPKRGGLSTYFSRTTFWTAALLRRFRFVILLLVYRLVPKLGV
jgi:hypothetical protein